METTSSAGPEDTDLAAVFDEIERDVAKAFRRQPDAFWGFLALLLVVIASPLVVFWVSGHQLGKDWSEIVKNSVESLALVAAAFGICKWLDERRNRATDVLLALDKEFRKPGVVLGRNFIEDEDWKGKGRSDALDGMLRFYVLLYGVFRARQVPEISLSICFRYWLAHYFRADRPGFRQYVDDNYPTLSNWLREDCCGGLKFFRPHRLFENVDQQFIDGCLKASKI